MNSELLGVILMFGLTLALAIPFGKYIAKVYSGEKTLLDFFAPLENFFFRISGIDAKREMNWKESIEKSTQIIKRTMSDLMSIYNGSSTQVANVDPADPATPPSKAFNFNQSFYSHYTYNSPNSPIPKSAGNVKLDNSNPDVKSMNILKSIHDIAEGVGITHTGAQGPYFKQLIGSIEMRSANGLRYFFNLPVFNKTTRTLQLAGEGIKPPVIAGDDYNSLGDGNNRNKVEVTDNYMYPYAWLLTAAVGDDYIDFDSIPGPSDGDIGY